MSNLRSWFEKPWVRNLAIGLILLVVLALLLSMRNVLAPLLIALAIAYVGDPVIDKFEEWKISRTWGIVILIFGFVLVILGLGFYLVPKMIYQLEELTRKLPDYWNTLRDKFLPQLQSYAQTHETEIEQYKETAIAWLQENAGMLLKNVTTGLASSFKSIGAFLANILGLVIIPVLAFYFLRDFDIMTAKMTKLIPPKRKPFVVGLFKELDEVLGNFIKGQLLVALILSIIYSIGLTIANCPAALLIGIIAGFSNLVPYLGIALGLVPAVLLTYLSGNPLWQVILAPTTFVVGQMLEGMVITPKVVGDSVGLHPAVVMIALMVGGTYFGIIGMILALPTTAVLMVLLKRTYNTYVNSILYHEGEIALPDEAPKPENA